MYICVCMYICVYTYIYYICTYVCIYLEDSFTLYSYIKYVQDTPKTIMRNAGLDESHTGIKIYGRNINNLQYADDTTCMAESEEELKSLLMKVKERVKKLA